MALWGKPGSGKIAAIPQGGDDMKDKTEEKQIKFEDQAILCIECGHTFLFSAPHAGCTGSSPWLKGGENETTRL